ncbi:MAG TPA: BlaI/MecI/CopY family transcriptional regulator [Edaphobacter sp.]|nr:BlaI/MecI/CopY family transcriptional regulator [Edaphobacter sp.]
MGDQDKEGLTRLELQIMQVIWRRGASNVGEVQEGLEQQLAYTTVQTMLNILHRKGKLRRRLRGRAYEYSAAVTEDKALSHALRDMVDRMFGGSSEELVMSLIKSRQLDAKKVAELGRKLEAEAKKQKEVDDEQR